MFDDEKKNNSGEEQVQKLDVDALDKVVGGSLDNAQPEDTEPIGGDVPERA